ncbi:MAG: tetratricopeptide repeat protein [Deltaproteobacteria bacterium]|nr:tetratricopeptide repeat protein [Deltaproteobacteria bacterium]
MNSDDKAFGSDPEQISDQAEAGTGEPGAAAAQPAGAEPAAEPGEAAAQTTGAEPPGEPGAAGLWGEPGAAAQGEDDAVPASEPGPGAAGSWGEPGAAVPGEADAVPAAEAGQGAAGSWGEPGASVPGEADAVPAAEAGPGAAETGAEPAAAPSDAESQAPGAGTPAEAEPGAAEPEPAAAGEAAESEPDFDIDPTDLEIPMPAVTTPPPEVALAQDTDLSASLPLPGGPGSKPAPFDPNLAPVWQALLAEYERELAAIGDTPAAAILHYESGKIWEEKLAQPKNAYQCYSTAFQLAPQLSPNIRAARRLASQVGNWNLTVQILDSEIESCADATYKAHLHHKRGQILEEKLGRTDEARASYQAALELAPDSVEFLRQMERLAISAGEWDRVIQVREVLLGSVADPRIKVQLLLSVARLLQVHFQDDARAEVHYLQVLELEPQNLMAIRALRQIYKKAQRHQPMLDLLLIEAGLTADPASAALLYYQAARIQREKLADDEKAIESLTQALNLRPDDHMLLSELAQVHETLMRWQELVEVYEKQVQLITDRQELVSIFFKLGNIWEEKLFNEDRAIPNYRKVVELNPNYLPALQALGKLFYRKGQWDDLVHMYEVECRETPDTKQRAVKLYKLAEILEERLSRDEEAIQKYEQSLELSPGYLPALKALGRLYTKYNRWESLIQMYEKELSVTQDRDQSVFLLDKIGALWEEKLNNVDKAIESYQRILETSPNYLPAIRTLGKLYVRADRWEDMIRVNELESQLINDQKQVISLLHRNGEIFEEKLNDKDRAIETYKQVLTLAPSYLPALQSLGRLYFIKGMWNDLIAMYRQEIDVTVNEAQQIALLYKIGELYEEKLGQEDDAIVAYREVLRIQADNFPAMKALIRIYSRRQDWENLLEILSQESAALEDPNQKALSLFRVAELWETRLQRPDKAIDTLQEILQIVPGHGPSIQALERLYANSGSWRELLGVYEQELQMATGETRQVSILFRVAEVYSNKINDLVSATECLERILSMKPDHLPTLEALERLYLVQRNYGALIRIYEALSKQASDASLQLALQAQIADLKENRLQPPQNAGENYLGMLRFDPAHPEASQALDILFHKFGTWHGLRILYERELARAQTIDVALDLCMRIADLAENRIDKRDVAIHYYQEALRLVPDHLPAIKALKRIYAAQDDAEAMIQMLDREGQITRDPRQSIATLLEAGQVYRDRFQNQERSIECFFKVLERDPREGQAFAQLEALLIATSDWERLVQLYRNKVGVTEDSRGLSELHSKMGGLLRSQLGRLGEAADCYREVLRINPSHLPALLALSEICFDLESWDEYIQLSRRILELATDSHHLAGTHHRLGIIYQEKKPELDTSIQHLIKAAELRPDNAEPLLRLKNIYTARQQWDKVNETLARLVQADPQNQVGYLLEQAAIFDTGIGKPEQAVEVYQRIQQLDPGNQSVIQRLGELYERLERWEELLETYQSFIALTPPDQIHSTIPLHMKVGQLLDSKLNNTDRAIIEYKRVIEISPRSTEAHEALAELYGRTGLYYANAIEEHRKLLEINPFRLGSYHELRRIFEEQRAFDKVFCTCAVLHYLRATDQNEEFFYGENVNKAPEKSSVQITPDEVERFLVHPDERGSLRRIMSIIGAHLGKLYPPDLARHGVGKGDRARPDDPLRTLTDNLAENLGGVEFDLFRSSQPTHVVSIENTSPPSIIVGEGLVKRTVVKEQRFAIARALKRIQDGSFLPHQLGAREIAKLVAAAVQPFHPNSPVATYPSDLPHDMAKKTGKALPRKQRKALEDLLKEIAPELSRVPDYETYLRGVENSANRAGLALSNDLPNAVMHLAREIPQLSDKRFNSSEELIQALSRFPSVCELLRFAVSEEYFNLRKRFKLSIIN